MSVSELSRQTRIRLPKIKAGILQKKTRLEIGVICGVSERTIRRDIESWTETTDFLRWAREVWLDLYRKVDDTEAFRQATKIVIKTIPTQAEVTTETTTEIKEEIIFKFDELSEDEREFCRRIARNYIKRNDKTRPHSIH